MIFYVSTAITLHFQVAKFAVLKGFSFRANPLSVVKRRNVEMKKNLNTVMLEVSIAVHCGKLRYASSLKLSLGRV